ncbi:MAG: hypothetical protein R2780_13110 [Crocinitomicaceae bacterium]|nr:hypothetical protein [Crocinitomicaceae bacterium]
MTVKDLERTLNDFILAISKIHIIGILSDGIFHEFPKELPDKVRKKWLDEADVVDKHIKDGKTDVLPFSQYGHFGSLSRIFEHEKKADFEQEILRQNLTNYVSYLEAFFQDINRIVYTVKPELLSGEKQIKWKDILDNRDFDSILQNTIDKELESSGYDKIFEQIERFNNVPFQFKIRIKKGKN